MSFAHIIERLARHQALKYINYALVSALILSSLLAARETINYFTSADHAPEDTTIAQEMKSAKAATALRPLSHYAPAVENNVFGIADQTLGAITASHATAVSTANLSPASTVPDVKIRLLGTVAWSDTTGYAFVSEHGNDQNMYKSGETIEGAGIMRGVHPDRIVMDFNGKIYEVTLEGLSGEKQPAATARPKSSAPAGRTPGGKDFSQFARRTGTNEYVVSKRAIDESIQNPQNILTDARLLPNIVDGAQNGFRVSEIKSGGLYEHLGIQNGDILLAVNDFKLASPESALQAFTTMQGASSIAIELKRRGKKISLKYNIR